MVSGYPLETRLDDEDDDNIYLVIKVTLFCLLQCLLAQFYLKGRLFKNSRIGIWVQSRDPAWFSQQLFSIVTTSSIQLGAHSARNKQTQFWKAEYADEDSNEAKNDACRPLNGCRALSRGDWWFTLDFLPGLIKEFSSFLIVLHQLQYWDDSWIRTPIGESFLRVSPLKGCVSPVFEELCQPPPLLLIGIFCFPHIFCDCFLTREHWQPWSVAGWVLYYQ